ncbi:MAG: iron-sulfur cluster repair di-iron protein [Pirellulaceae bacterium]|nr:MAG: iron-sulfur cluster repair di-iron protein [Pirellulaceae bacterium]
MATHESQIPIGRWVAQRPAAAAVLERAGIDYCCRGDRPLADACQERGIQVEQLLAAVAAEEQQIEQRQSDRYVNWLERPLAELCDHIEQTHHAYLKSELPRLAELIDKVLAAHAERHPVLRDIKRVFAELRAELEPHMFKEERILFPAVRQLEQAGGDVAFPFGSVANPIRVMEHEHAAASSALRELRELTGNYRPPADACNAYCAMLEALQNLEFDLHRHIHKENNILFPRAMALES